LRVQTRAEILRLQRRLETTTIYVTHDQVEAMTMGDRIAVMSNGLLQQIGRPPELYDKPVNLFVAAFIGSPAMNFARARAENGDVVLGTVKLDAAGPVGQAVTERKSEVVVGFRPEDLELGNGQAGDGAVRIPARVDVVEYLGNLELLHADAEGTEIVALVPSAKRCAPGDKVEFAIAPEKLHLFDPQTEERLV
jgi:multiple sugar transport system ATP-binding protein